MSHVNPPPQLSEATFRVYEPFIAEALSRWPDETSWEEDRWVNPLTSRPLSPHTFTARLRDSLVSFDTFKWETNLIPLDKFREFKGLFSVAYDGQKVWFKNRGRKGRPSALTKGAVEAEERKTAVALVAGAWENWDEGQIEAVCRLLHHERLQGPVLIAGPLPEALVSRMLESFNVWIHYDANLKQTIVN